MIKSRFRPPYKPNGKTNFPNTKNKTGTYLIADKNNNIVYVGYSGYNLYKTIYRHFQSWDDPTQSRATFPKEGYKLRVVFVSKHKAQKLEKALILKYKPKANEDKLEGYKLDKNEKKIENNYFDIETTNNDDLPF